jgi:hypothetical protein
MNDRTAKGTTERRDENFNRRAEVTILIPRAELTENGQLYRDQGYDMM